MRAGLIVKLGGKIRENTAAIAARRAKRAVRPVIVEANPLKIGLRARKRSKCGENRNHGKFKIYFLMVEL